MDNVAVFERESYETLIHDLGHTFKIEKAVRLNLKDYKSEEVHVDLVKITFGEKLSILIVSETLTYQSHVPL